VFENRVLRRVFGPKVDEETGEWRKLHSEELHILYLSPNIIRRMRWRGMWHAWERRENYTRFWWESPKERDLLQDQGIDGRMDLRKTGWEDVEWVQLAQDRGHWQAVVKCGDEPSGSGAT
jgi:hypothetical protein